MTTQTSVLFRSVLIELRSGCPASQLRLPLHDKPECPQAFRRSVEPTPVPEGDEGREYDLIPLRKLIFLFHSSHLLTDSSSRRAASTALADGGIGGFDRAKQLSEHPERRSILAPLSLFRCFFLPRRWLVVRQHSLQASREAVHRAHRIIGGHVFDRGVLAGGLFQHVCGNSEPVRAT